MNAKRRKEIDELIARLEKVKDDIYDILYDVECVKDEEQDCYDNLPEPIQNSEMGSQMEENIDNLDYAIDIDYEPSIDEIIEYLEYSKGE